MNIILDMDGVIVNFIEGACRVSGKDYKELYRNWPPNEYRLEAVFNMNIADLWANIDKEDSHFWSTLNQYEWSRSLYEKLKEYGSLFFLTSPSNHPPSLAGKLEWLHHFTGDNKCRNYLMGSPKFLCGKPENVLIDDSDANIESFKQAGGNAILFPQPWNKLNSYKNDKVEYVLSQMKALRM